MKILHTVLFYHPSVGGMQEVVKQISERLVELGHDVTVATSKASDRKDTVLNGVKIKEFDISGNYVHGIKGEVDRYKEFLLESDFDIITNFAAQQWATDIMLPILDKIKSKKVFVPTGFSGFYLPAYKTYFELMKQWIKEYDANVFLSNDYRDINYARENYAKNIVLIPNGAAEDEFVENNSINIRQKLGIPDKDFLVIHVGSHTGSKGHRECFKIIERSKAKDIAFVLIANSFGGGCTNECKVREKLFNIYPKRIFDRKKVVVETLSREETVAAYMEADMFLFPSNIECSPIVLFECMASKTLFLTSEVGNAAEIIEWSGGGVLLPTKKDRRGMSKVMISPAVKIFEKIVNDKGMREKLRDSGYRAWKEKFTWEKITKQYEKLYTDILS